MKWFLLGFLAMLYIASALRTLAVNDMFRYITTGLFSVTVAVLVYITFIFVISQVLKRLDIVDIAWGGAFIVAALTSFGIGNHVLGWNAQTLVSVLVILWGARLGFYILRRVSSHPEDARYVELRKKWKGSVATNAYFRIFFLQGILATIVSIAVIHINFSQEIAIGMWGYAGAAIWLVGFLFESIGDTQLKRHLTNPKNKGKLMTNGLWKYTRHPNYFGEATMWWGIFVISLGTEFGWVGVATPVVITYFLLFVSGVPMTEKRFEGRKGWSEYKKRTSEFLPLPPRKV